MKEKICEDIKCSYYNEGKGKEPCLHCWTHYDYVGWGSNDRREDHSMAKGGPSIRRGYQF